MRFLIDANMPRSTAELLKRYAPRTEIQEIYQKLGDLVADGSLSAVVEHVYLLEQFKEAFEQSLKSKRTGKILFKFGATDGTV